MAFGNGAFGNGFFGLFGTGGKIEARGNLYSPSLITRKC
ncbi:hypothetical protein [Dickeya phage JA15]|uniref:Uncharacterized protein n=1 Tax=Dickeya phage JA15 TaxID=1983655 RepID=A0A248H1U6_9CAUD|nr:hypothetical protein [Dickeya phage JA15]